MIRSLLAPNPGPMTLDGTNTYLVPAGAAYVVVDPGPLSDGHLAAVAAVGAVALIVLTHHHADHSAGAGRLAQLTGATVLARDPAYGDPLPRGGAAVEGLEVVDTPGHTGDSVCFAAGDPPVLLTGDTVLGRGTTVVAHPDGRLGAYLASLERLLEFVEARGVPALLPGHGPRIEDPAGVLTAYLAHRRERLDQVRAALAAGDRTPREVVARVYADVERALWPAAEQSVRAQLDYLTGPLD